MWRQVALDMQERVINIVWNDLRRNLPTLPEPASIYYRDNCDAVCSFKTGPCTELSAVYGGTV